MVGWGKRRFEAVHAAVVAGWRPLVVGFAVFVVSAIAFRLARVDAWFWTIDDAGITYAAAYELADHGTLAAYPGGTPVESYSNPLLFFVVVLLRLIGVFDPVRTHLHLEMLVFASMVTLVWSMLRAWTGELAAVIATAVFVAIQLFTPATWTWYGSGLENVWVSAGLVWLVWICARTARGVALAPGWGAVAFAVAITRPEAPVYVVAFFVALAAFTRHAELAWRTHVRRVAYALVVTAGLYLVFLAWRRIGYGAWWPNTFYAKVGPSVPFGDNLRDYVVAQVLPYAGAGLFALTALALVFAEQLVALALSLAVFLVATLALPITAGADWMGEHRFATAFFVVAHVTYTSFLAACVMRIARAPRKWQLVPIASLLGALVIPGLLWFRQMPVRDRIELNPVTLGHVARVQGGVRWIHQMRIGLPYPVAMIPDAGGSLLVGGMQMLDSALLAELQLARLVRGDGDVSPRTMRQYENVERRPDLVDFNMQVAYVDPATLGTTHLRGDSHLAARADRIKRSAIDPKARLVFAFPDANIYLSPETIQRAAPGALVRCELLVEWTTKQTEPFRSLRVSLGAEGDQIWLIPYQLDAERGIEMRALLIGAPRQPGTYPISIGVAREGEPWKDTILFQLHVTEDSTDLGRVAGDLVREVAPHQAARRIAWLREQLVPRLSMTQLKQTIRRLEVGTLKSATVGEHIHRLRWNARLAAFESLPRAIREAEASAVRAVLSTCSNTDRARHVLCIGREVDELRRLGYLDPLAHDPSSAGVIEKARETVEDLPLVPRYITLVGLTLADPGDVSLQRDLLSTRREVARTTDFPEL